MRALGLSRALALSTRQQRDRAGQVARRLGKLAAGLFDGATMHTPIVVTAEAVAVYAELQADCVIALGGGSTTGLGKAIARRTGAVQLVVPTTYAGSEVTPILGETENGRKTTRRGAEILPEVVIYDPDLSDGLPVPLSVTSGLNAMAHAAEGFYAQDGNPVSSVMAIEGLRAFRDALPAIIVDPTAHDSRNSALYGAWLCGTVLGTVGMSIHHELCHTLGGALDLPHADTNAILLPHTIAFVEEAIPAQLKPIADLFGGSAGGGLYDFAARVGAPTRLADLGVREDQLDSIADQAVANPYWCPRPIERDGIRALLQRAFEGRRP